MLRLEVSGRSEFLQGHGCCLQQVVGTHCRHVLRLSWIRKGFGMPYGKSEDLYVMVRVDRFPEEYGE